MTNRFTEDAKKVLSDAVTSAREYGHTFVGSEHLLLAITRTSPRCFANTAITYERMRHQIYELAGTGADNYIGGEDLTPKCKKILMQAGRHARDLGCEAITISHILMAILTEECVAKRIIEMEGISICDILMSLGSESREDTDIATEQKKRESSRPTPCLDKNGTDLTAVAVGGGIETIIGREAQEERIIRILLRKSKNNPCLIGEAGVGKTAIAESIAKRIAEGRVPDRLKDMRLITVDIPGIVAGTKYRGEFEEKLRNIINEAKGDDINLFVDEMHTIVGAGSAEGSVDASNILKPSLARRDIRMIGATTPGEYKRIIEKDPALERRFQPIKIDEPSNEECVKMLAATKKYYEAHHGVIITENAIEEAVRISSRFINGRKLPDKAVDLIDEAAANAVIKHAAILDGEDIVSIAAAVTGIPSAVLSCSGDGECERLLAALTKALVGQTEAIGKMTSCYRRYISRSQAGNRPSSIILAGEKGAGKTYAASVFTKAAGFSSVIRLDMNEFTEGHTVSKLIGSPPGYLGYGEETALAEKIRRAPYSALIFDSAEKAHPDVQAIVSRILEEGVLTDSSGNTVSFGCAFVLVIVSPQRGMKKTGFMTNGLSSAHIPEIFESKADETIFFPSLSDESMYIIASERCAACASGYFKGKLSFSKEFEEFLKNQSGKLSSASACVRYADRLMADVLAEIPKEEYAGEICVTSDGKSAVFRIPEKKA
ncbi:MAG: ATP-dependent Clp protease ATP-binding subunit [Eubacteriales bacterium]|nr:ATP-dependent Clp protease ATP-binding subunit [Eubacteriales bacterium]